MRDGPDIARTAALIGYPARANMLTALMTGKALTAGELAAQAGVTLQTASSHLAKHTSRLYPLPSPGSPGKQPYRRCWLQPPLLGIRRPRHSRSVQEVEP